MPKLVCDCGARYEHPDQIIACASVGHGKGGVEEQRLRDLNAELLEALKHVRDESDETYSAWLQGFDVGDVLPFINEVGNIARAAITKARKE